MKPVPRILVVDDNPAFIENLIEILTGDGYSATGYSTCAAALAGAVNGFEIALIDLRLPDGDGTTLAPKLKEYAPDSEVVFLTGFATVETAAAAVRAGAFAYLMKPCATSELLLTLQQAMRQVRLHTEKRELTRRAQVAEKMAAVGTMTAGLSHEIRNPLNAASLQLNVLDRLIRRLEPRIQPALQEPLKLVQEEIRRLDHILEDFLQFARPKELIPHPVDLKLVTGQVLDLLGGDAARRRVTIHRVLHDVPPVAGDESRLRQVLMNLTINALQAAKPEGWIRVSTSEDDDEVVVTIDDSGAGISEELRARIFEPFFTTKAGGSGLGLPIVHTIISQHGGTVTAGRAPGAGARFTIRLTRLR